MKNPLRAYINMHKERWNNDKEITQATLGKNPYFAMAALIEIIYFATDSLAPIRTGMGDGVMPLVTVLWHALAGLLALAGVLYLTPFGRRWLRRDQDKNK